ncbi:O-antigen ligase family protein [Chryseobacterium sp.]|jgi:O-antigen ligase|uniref:O-antigen ligase family protein n=1 Tax=Chryseobacterium sp. TaxID=1871047 RepID=UPI00284B6AD3|nr:O-antigen ligase family protein [Chryseobacterium sp.]MDR3026310.1 O-antigen ligase family protein [Chryseobacterium sp.]
MSLFTDKFTFFKVFIYFIFVFSGSLKWLPIPIDLTLLSLLFCAVVMIVELRTIIPIKVKDRLIVILILILSLIFLISNFYSISSIYAQSKTLAIILNIFTVIYPIIVFKKSIFSELKLLMYLIGGLMVIGLFYMYFNNMFIIFHDSELLVDKVPTYLVIGIMLCACFIFSLESKLTWYVAVYRLSILFLLFQLGGRGPIINVVLSLIVFFTLNLKNYKIDYKTGFAIGALFFTILIFGENIYTFAFQNVDFERFNIFKAYNDDASLSVRGNFLEIGIESILDHPFFGLGIGSSGFILDGTDVSNYPHNLFVESMMELGIFGGLLYLSTYILFFLRNYSISRNNKDMLILFIVVLLFYLEDNKSNSFDSWRCSIIWIMFFISEKRYKVGITN